MSVWWTEFGFTLYDALSGAFGGLFARDPADSGLELLSEALHQSLSLPDDQSKSHALLEIGRCLRSAGRERAARQALLASCRVALAIEESSYQRILCRQLVDDNVFSFAFRDMRHLLELTSSPFDRAELLARQGLLLLAGGQRRRGEYLIDQAQTLVVMALKRNPGLSSFGLSSVWEPVGMALAVTGHLRQALGFFKQGAGWETRILHSAILRYRLTGENLFPQLLDIGLENLSESATLLALDFLIRGLTELRPEPPQVHTGRPLVPSLHASGPEMPYAALWLPALEEALARLPDPEVRLRLQVSLGLQLHALGCQKDLMRFSQAIVEKNRSEPGPPKPLLLLARLAGKAGLKTKAEEYLRTASRQLTPNIGSEASIHLDLAREFHALGHSEEARQMILRIEESIRRQQVSAFYWEYVGEAWAACGDLPQVLAVVPRVLNEAVNEADDRGEALTRLHNRLATLIRLLTPDQLREVLAAARDVIPGHFSDVLGMLVENARNQNNQEMAMKVLERAPAVPLTENLRQGLLATIETLAARGAVKRAAAMIFLVPATAHEYQRNFAREKVLEAFLSCKQADEGLRFYREEMARETFREPATWLVRLAGLYASAGATDRADALLSESLKLALSLNLRPAARLEFMARASLALAGRHQPRLIKAWREAGL